MFPACLVRNLYAVRITHCSLPLALGGKVYSTEPQSGEGSPLDAAVSIALAGVLRSETPGLKICMDADF
jgi:hypothetical protein